MPYRGKLSSIGLLARMHFVRLSLLWLFILTSCSAFAAVPVVHSVRCHTVAGQTHVDILVNRPVQYHYFSLRHPERIVVDLDGARPRRNSHRLRSGCGIVRNIIRGLHRGHHIRYVLTVTHRAPYHIVIYPAENHEMGLSIRIGKPRPATRHIASTSPAFRLRRGHHKVVIAIDPGHGGRDPGTTGPHGLHEKTVVLEIAKVVAAKIDATPGLKAVLTRTGNYYVSLPMRVYLAQKAHASLFVSIHANAYPQVRSVEGGAVYMLSLHGASSAEARLEARAENAADPSIGGVTFSQLPQVNNALTEMMQDESITLGRVLGYDILHQLGRVEPLYEHRVQRADFAVLRDPMIPSVLVETAFLSNPTQALDFHHRWFIDRLASAIYRGIVTYVHNEHLSSQKVATQSGQQHRRGLGGKR